ncbi:hypothetical protein PsorP6_007997 [Peronosclerospora sorghi]|uniref:Uncharacterized protein n=1 Tax=Peronosclerospora sorghi TaxID=230839 RepID=A0ACC0WDN6_9STRA|nr:hypothetical protein PsorP6_007997 [Peronosclerospora sorghi]
MHLLRGETTWIDKPLHVEPILGKLVQIIPILANDHDSSCRGVLAKVPLRTIHEVGTSQREVLLPTTPDAFHS